MSSMEVSSESGTTLTLQGILERGALSVKLRSLVLMMRIARGYSSEYSAVGWYPRAARPVVLPQRMQGIIPRVLTANRTMLLLEPDTLEGLNTSSTNIGDHHRNDDLSAYAVVPMAADSLAGALVGVGTTALVEQAALEELERTRDRVLERLTSVRDIRHAEEQRVQAQPPTQPAYRDRMDVLIHELRSPLAAATYALERLDEAQRRENASTATEQLIHTARLGVIEAQSMLRVVRQFDALGTGRLQPSVRAVPLRDLLSRAIALVPGATERVRVQDPLLLPDAWADDVYVIQTLVNLIENALKYSRATSPVDISLSTCGRRFLLVKVCSYGGGMSVEFRPRMFEPYVRRERSDDLSSQGLGLSIARYFVTALGGELWAEGDSPDEMIMAFTVPSAV